MAHLQIIKPEDIKKIADNNIIPVCAPLWCPIDPEYSKHEIEYLGQDRVNSEYRVKSFFDARCKVNFHSDYPVSPSISMPLTIYAAVTDDEFFLLGAPLTFEILNLWEGFKEVVDFIKNNRSWLSGMLSEQF